MVVWSWVMLVLAALPAAMIAMNLMLYRPARKLRDNEANHVGPVSVLIPARDEADGIEAAVRAVLAAGEHVDLEVVVLDDHSTDGTDEIVQRLTDEDPRVRLERAPELPDGWNGKQHACWILAQRAKSPTLLWVDADVRLTPGSVARMERYLRESQLPGAGGGAKLISGVPRQITGTWLELFIVPQILWVLLGYLPMVRMRQSAMPGFGAGCGQLFVADREAYFACGGHEAIGSSMHDGVDLPRLFRRHGYMTDLFDATDAAVCRMYTNAADTWRGFTKNATAGMGSRKAIGIWTVLLTGGQVLPWGWLIASAMNGSVSWMAWAATGCAAFSSVAIALAFRQGAWAALVRPLGIIALIAVQWAAPVQAIRGVRPTWRGRVAA